MSAGAHAVQRSGELAVFDLDGTITRHDTLLPFMLGLLLRRPWRLPRLLAVVPALLHFVLDRDHGALKGRVIHHTLGGLPRALLQRWSTRFVTRLLRTGVFAEALEAIEAHRVRGDALLLMSASVDLYVPQIGRALGFERVICTQVRWHGERLDGRLASANCRDEEKRRCLAAVLAGDAPGHVTAYGNSAADLPHLALARRAYLVNAASVARRHPMPQLQTLHWWRRGQCDSPAAEAR